MALKKDKQMYKVKVPNGHVPYVPAQSYFSVAFDNMKPTLTRLQNEADQTAMANYFQDFQITTRENFEKFRNEFSHDPEGMKVAVDNYAKTLLEEVPPAYKIQANAMLSSYSQNSILYATGNKNKFDNGQVIAKSEKLWQNTNTEAEFGMSAFSSGTGVDFNLDIIGINSIFKNNLNNINELAHDDFENLVKTTKITEKSHISNVEGQAEALMVARGYHMMLAMYNNGQDVQALNWLNDYKNGKDVYPFEFKDKENPIFKMVDGLYKDDDARLRIVDKIHKKFKATHDSAIFGKKKKAPVNLEMFKEPGQILSLENFIGGTVNVDDIAAQIPNLEIGSAKYNELVEYVANANRIQGIVAETMTNDELYNFKSDEDRELWAKAILANNGIHQVDFSDLESDAFQTAINTFAEQDYFPDEVRKYLTISDSGSFKDEKTLKAFSEKALMYQYLSNDELFPNVDYNPLYQKALDSGAISSIANGDYNRATEILESLQNENYEKKIENINLQFDGNNKTFEYMFNSQLQSPNWLHKFFMNKKDPLHKHLFAAGDQTTVFAWEPKEIVPPEAMGMIKAMWHEEMAAMTVGENPDIWSKQNAHLRSKAWNRTMKRMVNEGWGISTHTQNGKPKLVKNPFWHTYGALDNNDVFASIKEDFMSLEKNEQMSKYGTNNWDNVHDWFKQWADDSEGNVRISIDRMNYKDQHGNHTYKLSMHLGDEMITLDNNFKPTAWTNFDNPDAPSSTAQIINHTTNKIYENFKKTSWYDMLPEDKKHWSKRAVYSIIRNGIKLSDFRFYPDVPGIDDVPAEVRPFAWVAKILGFDGDIREIRTDLQMAADVANKNLSYAKKINANRNLNDKEKLIESLMPPEKTVMTDNAMSLNFKHWVLENYQNEDLRLTHRTNNWTAISSAGWDGELNVKYQRDSRRVAVFAHPKNSIRAVAKLFLNHSILTENINGDKIPSEYGSEPTIEDILTKTKYATDMASYFRMLEDHPTLSKDTRIDLLNANQMHSLIKMIMKHEMGSDYYLETFGENNAFVDSTIFRGIKEAFNSYNGELGKL